MPPKVLAALALLPVLAACAGATSPAPRAAAPASGKAEALIGKGPEALRAMLGEPSLLRRDQGAEVWQYAGETCVLFLYLYPDDSGAPQVSYVDARLKSQGPAPVPECLAEALRAQKRERKSGVAS